MSDLKFCACAIIDLQGFSQHLELGAHDVRTNIGEEAIKRLDNLSEILDIIDSFQANYPNFYPKKFYKTRINDALIFNIDLHPDLMPNIGEQIKKSYSPNELGEKFNFDSSDTVEEMTEKVRDSYRNATVNLQKFVGLISRVHQHINDLEDQSYFPGAKTIIALGQRKPFIEKDGTDDPISANFAFSNAYKADSKLGGSNLFIDNNVLKLLSVSNPCHNLTKLAVYEKVDNDKISFSLFNNDDRIYKALPSIEVSLFRKEFKFQKMNPHYLSALQLVKPLFDFSQQNKSETKKRYKADYDFLIDQNLEINAKEYLQENFRLAYKITLTDPLQINFELLTQEKSDILEEQMENIFRNPKSGDN